MADATATYVITDRELWACANLLLRQHGCHARDHAHRRADVLLASGQKEGHRTFRLIAERIRALQQTTSDEPHH